MHQKAWQTDGRTEGRTTSSPEAICPSNFFEAGGIKTQKHHISIIGCVLCSFADLFFLKCTLRSKYKCLPQIFRLFLKKNNNKKQLSAQCGNTIEWTGRSQLIWICTVCHSVFEFVSTTWMKLSDWLKIRSGCGILIYSARVKIWRSILLPVDVSEKLLNQGQTVNHLIWVFTVCLGLSVWMLKWTHL